MHPRAFATLAVGWVVTGLVVTVTHLQEQSLAIALGWGLIASGLTALGFIVAAWVRHRPPAFQVWAESPGRDGLLVVRNNGGPALVSARAKILGVDEGVVQNYVQGQSFSLPWSGVAARKHSLGTFEQASLVLGSATREQGDLHMVQLWDAAEDGTRTCADWFKWPVGPGQITPTITVQVTMLAGEPPGVSWPSWMRPEMLQRTVVVRGTDQGAVGAEVVSN